MSSMTPKVDGYLRKNKTWQAPLQRLRSIVLECGLTEEVKWRVPCYTLEGRNVIILGAFKEWCVLSFFKGALLKDPRQILEMPGPNTQAGRVIRFRSEKQVADLEPVLKAYVLEAIAVEKSGVTVAYKKPAEVEVPDELRARFAARPAFEKAFHALTPGRQRAYLLHFSSAKQSKTRESRIERSMERILEGKGLDD